MKIVIISDTHGKHSQISLPDGDILLHCGDESTIGNKSEWEDFFGWFKAQSHKYKLFVPGNHSMYVEQNAHTINWENVELLWDREINIDGIRIYGSPYRVVPYERIKKKALKWSAFMIDETWAEFVWRDIPFDVDILATHMPPNGILDKFDNISWGSSALLKAITEKQIKISAFGHIHAASGTLELDNKLFINASICDDRYDAVNKPKVIEYDQYNKTYNIL